MAIAQSLDAAIAQERKHPTMIPEDKLSVCGDFDPAEHEAEADQRWGGTAAYAQSKQRSNPFLRG